MFVILKWMEKKEKKESKKTKKNRATNRFWLLFFVYCFTFLVPDESCGCVFVSFFSLPRFLHNVYAF